MSVSAPLLLLLSLAGQQAAPAPQSARPTEASSTDAAATLHEKLRVFAPLVGKTFRGEFAQSTPEKPMVDVSRWERALNGQAVRILHSVNDGAYGGETILMWDSTKERVAFWYFTTAGFQTQGTMEIEGNRWSSVEKVQGSSGGITEVKATSELTADGQLVVKSQYLRNGAWEPGHEIRYAEAPSAKVVFK